jgi:phosphoribosylanthranilate isomerase
MSLWIKICGNTSLEDALLGAENGADAVGFVFAPSPRRVTAKQVAGIAARLPESLEKIGVFVDSSAEEIEATVRGCGLSGVQLQFEARRDLTARLRERFGPQLRILRVLHYAEGLAESAVELAHDKNIDALLLDSRTATAVGGTGVAFDWKSAAADLSADSGLKKHIVVAGGLTASNVADAIATLHPWGVDVVSGVEAMPGSKDPDKVRRFIAQARAAVPRARTVR